MRRYFRKLKQGFGRFNECRYYSFLIKAKVFHSLILDLTTSYLLKDRFTAANGQNIAKTEAWI